MKADTLDLTQIFFRPIQYRVPLFQRPYVWERVKQWEPLWDDIEAVVAGLLKSEPTRQVPPHFLGAVVFDRVLQPPGMVDARTVVDGQQRLTTLLLFINAARKVAGELGLEAAARRFAQLLYNDELLARSEEQRLKIVPSEFDRPAFLDVMWDETRPKPVSPEGRRIREASEYFTAALRRWGAESPAIELDTRFDALNTTVWRLMQMVVIDLGEDDNPQVIFESLNARGTPLLAADLVKNLLFQQIEKDGRAIEPLYAEFWRPLDTDSWRRQVRQGRLIRPRIDVFVMHWLTMTLGTEVSADDVYLKFRQYLRSGDRTAPDVLAELRTYADVYDSFDRAPHRSEDGRFFYHLREMDTSTAYPVLLWMFGPPGMHSDVERRRSIGVIDSWLVRRLVCGLTTKAYNDVFGQLLSTIRKADGAADSELVARFFGGLKGPNQEWPTDDQVRSRLRTGPAYTSLVRRRLRMLLEAIEEGFETDLSEHIAPGHELTVEHVLPQDWKAHWPLPDGVDVRDATIRRDEYKHRLGNLTLITHRLNATQSNSAWMEKRKLLDRYSLLLISKGIVRTEQWDEAAIEMRTDLLIGEILRLWPAPRSSELETKPAVA